ncbi:hypothetical protein LS68_008930 [Helicobacter sp. MIT 05-5293]|uniref:type IV secretion system protein n=1 Tax=Helicobacter sp. MIT 05-5293 TaxID=1548149 RepID=UPI0009DCA64E|nr:type IV secretion system protein [Helicobacter sp. MIT 05-5293]TLD79953.1 hypothetical protein LS68_008930 [Helicobacter sp. MIT 05-5293]
MAEKSVSVFTTVVNIVKETGNAVVANVYGAIGDLYSNNIAYTFLGLSVVIWVFMKLKGDGFSRDDLFKAMIWVVIFIVIKASLSSYQNYRDFISIFQLPYKWASAGVSAYGNAGNVSANIDYFWGVVNDTSNAYMEAIKQEEGKFGFHLGDRLIVVAFLIVSLVLMIAVIIMTILSQFMATIILSFCALVLPCLCFSQTKGVFFGWLKLYIGMSLWAPLSIVVMGIPQSAITRVELIKTENTSDIYVLLIPIVMSIFAVFLLTKIPAWISAIIGSADSSGAGSGLAGLASAGGFAANKIIAGVKGSTKADKKGESGGNTLGANVSGGKTDAKSRSNLGENTGKGGEQLVKDGFKASATPLK